MVNSKIVSEILQYTGTDCTADWYVGIATDVKKRLFVDHNVPESGSAGWIYREANSERECRDTECYLLEHYRFKGDTGGGDKPLYVYAYRITANTVEQTKFSGAFLSPRVFITINVRLPSVDQLANYFKLSNT